MSYLQQHAVEAHGQAAALLLTVDNILLELGQQLIDAPLVQAVVETKAEVVGDWRFEQAWLCYLRTAAEIDGVGGCYELAFHASFHGEWQSRKAARGKKGLGPAMVVTAEVLLGPTGVSTPRIDSVAELHYQKQRSERRPK